VGQFAHAKPFTAECAQNNREERKEDQELGQLLPKTMVVAQFGVQIEHYRKRARMAEPERFSGGSLVLACVVLVLLYLFRPILSSAFWAISSYPATRVHSEDFMLHSYSNWSER
jgi:hypothetical protein